MVLNKEIIEIIPIINAVFENIKLKYENVNIEIETFSEEIKLDLDAFHFTNLVFNLLDNAIKYCDIKPMIIIRIIQKDNKIILEFEDNGIGIDDEDKHQIFDKFYRAKTSKSYEINGFGLGLYYVKKICDLHNWKINAKNNNLVGTTISITI